MKVHDASFLVTGGGSGIGQELVLRLLERGASAVAAVDIRPAGLDETLERAGEASERVSTHIADVADKAAVERHGHVDAIVNNAGIIQAFKRVKQLEDRDIERVMNVFSRLMPKRAMRTIQRQLKALLEPLVADPAGRRPPGS